MGGISGKKVAGYQGGRPWPMVISQSSRQACRGAAACAATTELKPAPWLRYLSSRHLRLALEVLLHPLRGQHEVRVVFGTVLELLEVVQAAGLVDAVGGADEAHRLVGVRI